PAHDLESLVVQATRAQLANPGNGEGQPRINDRDLIEQHIERVIIKSQAIEIHLNNATEPKTGNQHAHHESDQRAQGHSYPILSIPWTISGATEVKGILDSPTPEATMSPESRDMLLSAIAKARAWIDDLVEGRAESFTEIANREGKAEAHVRFLAPLAFVSP